MQKNLAPDVPAPVREETPLPPPNKKARALHATIIAKLKDMLALNAASPLDPAFAGSYSTVLELFGAYQQEIIAGSKYMVTCGKRCSCAAIIGWLTCILSKRTSSPNTSKNACRKKFPPCAPPCAKTPHCCKHLMIYWMNRFSKTQARPLFKNWIAMICCWRVFTSCVVPCPLLDASGACSIYMLRPMSCRAYLSFSDPLLCDPDTIYYHEVLTCLCTLEQEADELLEKLHARYDHCDCDTSLRTLLPYYLEGFRDCILKRII